MVRGSGAAVLTDPSVVLHELRRQHQPEADPAELQHVERLLASLMDRERRLVKLFSFGEVDEEVVREQMAEICRERGMLEERLRSLRPVPTPRHDTIDEDLLARACRAVERWLSRRSRSPSLRRARRPRCRA